MFNKSTAKIFGNAVNYFSSVDRDLITLFLPLSILFLISTLLLSIFLSKK